MNHLIIFVIRLILGLAFGILLIRIFRPEWGMMHGAGSGLILVAIAYGMAYFKRNSPPK